jgi:hypothetical protein
MQRLPFAAADKNAPKKNRRRERALTDDATGVPSFHSHVCDDAAHGTRLMAVKYADDKTTMLKSCRK